MLKTDAVYKKVNSITILTGFRIAIKSWAGQILGFGFTPGWGTYYYHGFNRLKTTC